MIIFTPPPRAPESRRRLRGFTLTELMVAATLSTVVLAAILSSFLFIGRAGAGLQNYADMESQARKAMETFAMDIRMASGVVWHSAHSVTVTTWHDGATATATYTYHPSASLNAPARSFTRTTAGDTQILITEVRSFAFNAYSIDTLSVPLTNITAATNLATKQIQISLETERAHRVLALATNKVISARFVLRNKRVTA
jgi:prepilin-type N-terminal cleavage/methylation domain-containing protein